MNLESAVVAFAEALATGVGCAKAFNRWVAPVLVELAFAPGTIAAIETAIAAYCVTFGTSVGRQGIADISDRLEQLIQSAGPVNYKLAPLYGGPPPPPAGQLEAPMACVTTHSSKVQGAGLCCAAVQSGALTPPPPGTTLPVYTPGQAYTLPPGRITTVTDSAGHCASCMIVGSSSRKHPGRPVLKFIRGGPSCPTAGTGCCAMAAA